MLQQSFWISLHRFPQKKRFFHLKQNSVSFTSYSSKHREQQAFICLLMMVVTPHLMKSEVLITARSTQSPQPGVYREIVPPTKFSKICLVVSYNNKLQSFCFPENMSLLRPCSPSWTFTAWNVWSYQMYEKNEMLREAGCQAWMSGNKKKCQRVLHQEKFLLFPGWQEVVIFCLDKVHSWMTYDRKWSAAMYIL